MADILVQINVPGHPVPVYQRLIDQGDGTYAPEMASVSAPSGPATGIDIAGSYPNGIYVTGIQQVPVDNTAPSVDDQVYAYKVADAKWELKPLLGGAFKAVGTTAGTLAAGDDSRLSNARTPTAHAATHITGGGDTIAGAVAGGAAGLLTGADKTKLDHYAPATGKTLTVSNSLTLAGTDGDTLTVPASGGTALVTANLGGSVPHLVAAPVAANSAGAVGSVAYDTGFFYQCVATNTWLRAAIATWP